MQLLREAKGGLLHPTSPPNLDAPTSTERHVALEPKEHEPNPPRGKKHQNLTHHYHLVLPHLKALPNPPPLPIDLEYIVPKQEESASGT